MSDGHFHPKAEIHGDTARVDLNYPRSEPVKFIQVGLCDVRAADDIRISYDFERDGWKIEQEEIIDHGGAYHSNGNWQEVAFVQAWGRTREVDYEQN